MIAEIVNIFRRRSKRRQQNCDHDFEIVREEELMGLKIEKVTFRRCRDCGREEWMDEEEEKP